MSEYVEPSWYVLWDFTDSDGVFIFEKNKVVFPTTLRLDLFSSISNVVLLVLFIISIVIIGLAGSVLSIDFTKVFFVIPFPLTVIPTSILSFLRVSWYLSLSSKTLAIEFVVILAELWFTVVSILGILLLIISYPW